MRFTSCIFFNFFFLSVASGIAAETPETPHLVFVSEYVYELSAFDTFGATLDEAQQTRGNVNESLLKQIHDITLYQLELKSRIHVLDGMTLKAPNEKLIPEIAGYHERQFQLYQELIDLTTAFLGGAKPDLDYGKLYAQIPKIEAELQYLDGSLFSEAPIIFATLQDRKRNSKNLADHLIITRSERATLLRQIANIFGSKLDDQSEKSFTEFSAMILKRFLQDSKCSDDP